jgi:hypothetical protein
VQSVPLAHATDVSPVRIEPVGFGLGYSVHAVPFQCSMSVDVRAPALHDPTAKQCGPLTHATERKTLEDEAA